MLGRSGNDINKDLILDRIKIDAAGCWIWQGTLTHKGYGQVRSHIKRYPVHRLSMHLWHGFDLASPLVVCHRCDNPPCCNPDHLFVGTLSDNARDSVNKGRWVNNRGSHHGRSILDEDDVLLMKVLLAEGWTHPTLAEVFPVSYRTINQISSGKRWSHV